MDPPPPPPPPHGENPRPKRGGLPDGPYDIFIVPPHASGSGFLYLPSLQVQRNSFLAGVACTLFFVAIYLIVLPVLKDWFSKLIASGGMGVVMLLVGVGVVSWAWGKTQAEGGWQGMGGVGGASNGASGSGTHHSGAQQPNTHSSQSSGYPPPPPPPNSAGAGSSNAPPPKSSWQRSTPQPAAGAAGSGTAHSTWEKAREETKKKEEERRKVEELKKKREADEKKRQEQREKDAKEREARERKEKLEKEAAERAAKRAAEVPKTSPKKPQPPPPMARTETEDDAYSFRPYDRPKRPAYKTSASSIYSEASAAPSQSTSRTTPPPSHRGPYTTKDPDKIIIKAVYSFTNAFMKTPVAQLISGKGSVTDGLILRITTEGLFIDDDIRGVPQREWDVKAWTMKLAEVWCPKFGASSGSTASPRRFDLLRRPPTSEESDQYLLKLAAACKSDCRLASAPSHRPPASSLSASFSSSRSTVIDDSNVSTQSGELNGLHVLRASIRDQEGKKYVFILQQSEGWKVAIGLQRLRRGTQVRALAVAGLPTNETNAIIQQLGWA